MSPDASASRAAAVTCDASAASKFQVSSLRSLALPGLAVPPAREALVAVGALQLGEGLEQQLHLADVEVEAQPPRLGRVEPDGEVHVA
eukprot:2729820-Rhodomonas_salina.3